MDAAAHVPEQNRPAAPARVIHVQEVYVQTAAAGHVPEARIVIFNLLNARSGAVLIADFVCKIIRRPVPAQKA